MLYSFVGPIDSPAAAVLVALFAALCTVAITAMVVREHRRNEEAEIELRRIRQRDEKEFNLKQLEKNLITSHERVS